MAVSQPYVKLVANAALPVSTPGYTSDPYWVHPSAVGAAMFLYSSVAGNATPQILMSDGNWRAAAAAIAVTANDLNIIDFTVKPRAIRVVFVPTVTPATISLTIDASGKGVSQPT